MEVKLLFVKLLLIKHQLELIVHNKQNKSFNSWFAKLQKAAK